MIYEEPFSGCIGVTGELKVFIGDLKVIDVKL